MGGIDLFLNYLSRSSFITIIVLVWLSIYFIISFTILFSRMAGLSKWQKREQSALESLLMGSKILPTDASLRKCAAGEVTRAKLNVCLSLAEKNATSGLAWLSIIASTSPFIGLFGTVISILETFSGLGNGSNASLGIIAPAISEALVATGAGIFVAIPAYTFNLLIKRRSYELMGTLERQADVLISMKE
ncbi:MULTISPECIES: MotA/TolQ/ExbB proton channel family protein [unclassified Campylobacter]|uniref:MotA/TolQ/ExbB proton channel family protein n=1 Tax=unclassified Campylobacter TaxID=2593542 RepID=UPI003D34C6B5